MPDVPDTRTTPSDVRIEPLVEKYVTPASSSTWTALMSWRFRVSLRPMALPSSQVANVPATESQT